MPSRFRATSTPLSAAGQVNDSVSRPCRARRPPGGSRSVAIGCAGAAWDADAPPLPPPNSFLNGRVTAAVTVSTGLGPPPPSLPPPDEPDKRRGRVATVAVLREPATATTA